MTHSKLRAKSVVFITAAVFLLCSAYLWGIFTIRNQIFPYHLLKLIYGSTSPSNSSFDPQAYLNHSTNCVADGESLSFDTYSIRLINHKAPFAVRDGAGAIVFEDNLYLIGGWNPNDKINFPRVTSNDVWRSSDYGATWTEIKPNSYGRKFVQGSDWEGRHTAGYVTHGNFMYIVGGDANQGYHIDDIWRSSDGINWELLSSNPPWAPRALHLTFTYKNKIYVVGGQTMPAFAKQAINENYLRDIWSSSDGVDWDKVEVSGDLFTPRGGYGGSGFVLNDSVFIIGGFTYDNLVNRDRDVWTDVWASSGDLTSWRKVGSTPTDIDGNGFMYHDTAFFDSKLWIIGGARKVMGNTNEIWFSDDGVRWTQVLCSPLKPTHATSVWSTSKGIVIAAGNGWDERVFIIEKRSSSAEIKPTLPQP